jgi:hypothetical protein
MILLAINKASVAKHCDSNISCVPAKHPMGTHKLPVMLAFVENKTKHVTLLSA